MNYFKNVELAKKYNVSENTIHNWVESAKENRISLQLVKANDKFYIKNTQANHTIMLGLVLKGKKFKTKKALKNIEPSKKFFEIFDKSHVIDIIHNLEKYKEVPHKYAYFGDGSIYWDRYINKIKNETNNGLIDTLELFNLNIDYIYPLIKDKKVNLIDVGPGNGYPVKGLIEFLQKKNIFNKYIGIDFSNDILKVDEKNLKKWFGENFPFEGHIRDAYNDNFRDIIFDGNQNSNTINLVVLLGGCTENQRVVEHALRNLNSSLSTSDIFVITTRLDTPNTRIYFDFSTEGKSHLNDSQLEDIEQEKITLDLLNIIPELYEIHQYYSETEKCRNIKIKLKSDLQIHFKNENIDKTVSLSVNDMITLWSFKHHTYTELLNIMDHTGYNVRSASISSSSDEVMIISKVKAVE